VSKLLKDNDESAGLIKYTSILYSISSIFGLIRAP